MRNKRKKSREPSRAARGVGKQYDEGTLVNPHLKAAIVEVVENQIRDGNPPETRQTLERLQAAGYSRQQAVEMIGSAVVEEIWAVLHDNKPFDRARFAALLEQLGQRVMRNRGRSKPGTSGQDQHTIREGSSDFSMKRSCSGWSRISPLSELTLRP